MDEVSMNTLNNFQACVQGIRVAQANRPAFSRFNWNIQPGEAGFVSPMLVSSFWMRKEKREMILRIL